MLITIDLQAVIGQFVGGQKPGQCPVSDIITTCDCPTNQMECYTDFHCPFGNYIYSEYPNIVVLCMHSILHVTLAIPLIYCLFYVQIACFVCHVKNKMSVTHIIY